MPPELHPYAMGICVAIGSFWAAMILADVTDWLLHQKTEEDKKDAD